MKVTFPDRKNPLGSGVGPHPHQNPRGFMSLRKLIAIATIAGLVTACSDITGPSQTQKQQTGWCPVTGSGQTCDT